MGTSLDRLIRGLQLALLAVLLAALAAAAFPAAMTFAGILGYHFGARAAARNDRRQAGEEFGKE